MSKLEIGLDTFGDRTRGADGNLQSHAQVLRNLVEQAELADRVGLAFFGVDEQLFEDKLELSAKVRAGEPVRGQRVFPPVEHGRLRTWIGVGGSPESVVRAARYGFDLMLAIIGGDPARFTPFVQLYQRALGELGQAPGVVGVHAPGHVAETDAQAREELWPHFLAMRTKIGAERGWPPPTRAQFEREAGPNGALFVGSPETVARKIATTARTLSLSRFDLKYSNGPMPHEQMMRSIELIGREVVPRVDELLERSAADDVRHGGEDRLGQRHAE